MADSERDPRVDPQTGDEVEIGPQWQREIYVITGCNGHQVEYTYRSSRFGYEVPLRKWREWCREGGATVIRRAE